MGKVKLVKDESGILYALKIMNKEKLKKKMIS